MKWTVTALLIVAFALPFAAEAGNRRNQFAAAWGCKLEATVLDDPSNNGKNFFKHDEMEAYGTIICGVVGRKAESKHRVFVRIVGNGFRLGRTETVPNAKMNIWVSKAGITTPETMYGQFTWAVGPGHTARGWRTSVDWGAEYTPSLDGHRTPDEMATSVLVMMRELEGRAVDFTWYRMWIQPVSSVKLKGAGLF